MKAYLSKKGEPTSPIQKEIGERVRNMPVHGDPGREQEEAEGIRKALEGEFGEKEVSKYFGEFPSDKPLPPRTSPPIDTKPEPKSKPKLILLPKPKPIEPPLILPEPKPFPSPRKPYPKPPTSTPAATEPERLIVEVESGLTEVIMEELKGMGLEVETHYKDMIQVIIPSDMVEEVLAIAGVKRVRPPMYSTPDKETLGIFEWRPL